jgi:hypothetical protein
MPQIDIKLATTADLAGFNQVAAGLESVRQKVDQAGKDWENFGRRMERKFSMPDIAKHFLGGMGLGSGFAVAEKLAGAITDHFKEAAEYAKAIEESTGKQLQTLERMLHARRSDSEELDYLLKKQKELMRDSEELKKPKTVMRPKADYGLVGDIALEVEDVKIAASDADLAKAAELAAQAQEIAAKIDEIQRKIAEKKKNAESDAAKSREDANKAEVEEREKTEAAIKRVNDALGTTAEKYREIGDPVERYKKQILEVENLTRMFDSSGNPFISSEDAAAAIAKLNLEITKLKFEATGGFTPAINAARDAIEKYDEALNDIGNNNALTDSEKREQKIAKLKEENKEIEKQVQALKDLAAANPGMNAQSLLSELGSLGKKQTANNKGIGENPETLDQKNSKYGKDFSDPSKHYQSAASGLSGSLLGQINEIGTWGDQIERTFTKVGASIRTSLGSAFSDMLLKGGSFTSKLKSLWNSVVTNFVQAGAQMVADWAFQHTIMAAWSAMFHTKDLTLHETTEASKTSVTAVGTGTRILLGIKEGMVWLWQAGVKAMTALASIPYVGPVLAIAALAAILGTGIKAMKGFESGGYTERGKRTEVAGVTHKGEWVAPNWQVDHPVYGPIISALEEGRIGGYAMGGFVKKMTGWKTWGQSLGSGGLPSWALPGTKKFQTKWNLLDGTSLYGAATPASTQYYNSATKSWQNTAAALTQPAYQPATTTGGASAAGQGEWQNRQQKEIHVSFVGPNENHILEAAMRNPHWETYIVNTMRKNRGMLGIKV